MADVLPFAKRPKPSEDPTDDGLTRVRGPARCGACSHTWEALVPIGAPGVNGAQENGLLGLECPACHALKGMLSEFCSYPGTSTWTCRACRSIIFSIILGKGDVPCLSCACCGQLTNALDIFNKP